MKHKVYAAIAALMALVLMLTGCSLSPEKLLEDALAYSAQTTNREAEMTTSIGISLGEKQMQTVSNAHITTFDSPLKMKIEVETLRDEEDTDLMTLYSQVQGDDVETFSRLNESSWAKQTTSLQAFQATANQYDAAQMMAIYAQSLTDLKAERTKWEDKSCFKLTGKVTGSGIGDVVKNAGILDGFLGAEMDDTTLNTLLAGLSGDLSDIQVTMYLDETHHSILQMELEMQEMMHGMMSRLMEVMAADVAPAFQVTACNTTIRMLAYDTAPDFEIPEEATK